MRDLFLGAAEVLGVGGLLAVVMALPLRQTEFALGNAKWWKVRSNLLRVQTLSDCTAWDFDATFHQICMTLLKEGNQPATLTQWKRAVCATVANSVGLFADIPAACAAQFAPVCAEAQRLSLETVAVLSVCCAGAALLLSARLMPWLKWVQRGLGLAALASAALYLSLRRSGYVLLHADQASVPFMHDARTYMLTTTPVVSGATPFIHLVYLMLSLTASVSAYEALPRLRRWWRGPPLATPRELPDEEAPLLFWAVTPHQ